MTDNEKKLQDLIDQKIQEISQLQGRLNECKETATQLYLDLMEMGAMTYQIVQILGLDKLQGLSPEDAKSKIGKTIIKSLGDMMMPGPFRKGPSLEERFAFLEGIIPLYDRWKDHVEKHIESKSKQKLIDENEQKKLDKGNG